MPDGHCRLRVRATNAALLTSYVVILTLLGSACSSSTDWVPPAKAQLAARGQPDLAKPAVPRLLGSLGDQFFDHNSTALDPDGLDTIKLAASELNDSRYSGTLCVVGLTDGTGSESTNLRIAALRAETVKTEIEKVWTGTIEVLPIGERGAEDNVSDPSRRRVDMLTEPCDERSTEWD